MKHRSMKITMAVVALVTLVATGCTTATDEGSSVVAADARAEGTSPGSAGTSSVPSVTGTATTAGTPPDGTTSPQSVTGTSTENSTPTSSSRSSGSGTKPSATAAYPGEVGVTTNTVTIGALTVESGPYAAITKSVEPGMRAAIETINAAGGIHGRDLVLRTEDGTFDDAGAAVEAARKMKDHVFGMFAQGSTASIAVSPFADEQRFPFLAGITTKKANLDLRYAFPASTYHVDQAAILPSFIVNHLGDDAKNVGILYQQLPQADEVRAVVKARGKAVGLKVVSEVEISNNPGPCSNQISKLQEDGATLVVLFVGPPQAIQCLRDSRNAVYNPTWTGIGPTFDFQVTATASGGATNGIRMLSHRRTMESKEGQRYLEAMSTYYPDRPDVHDDLGFWAWGLTHMFAEGLRGAGRNLTREGWVEAMENLNGWDGGFYPPQHFGPGDRKGPGKTIVVEGQGNGFVTVDGTWRSSY